MSPSEVIIEVYIMPEDASFGAFFFQFKDFITRESDVFVSSHFVAGAWLGSLAAIMLFPLGQGTPRQQEGVGRDNLNCRCASCGRAPSPALGPLHPKPGPMGPFLPLLFSILTKALYRIVLITFRC